MQAYCWPTGQTRITRPLLCGGLVLLHATDDADGVGVCFNNVERVLLDHPYTNVIYLRLLVGASFEFDAVTGHLIVGHSASRCYYAGIAKNLSSRYPSILF